MLKFHHIACALLLVTSASRAGDDIGQAEARALKEAGAILPLENILDASQKIRPGRVLEVELEKKRDHYIYELEVVDKNGVVWEMKFDAKTATLISQEQDD